MDARSRIVRADLAVGHCETPKSFRVKGPSWRWYPTSASAKEVVPLYVT
jgi:hypothetical protein